MNPKHVKRYTYGKILSLGAKETPFFPVISLISFPVMSLISEIWSNGTKFRVQMVDIRRTGIPSVLRKKWTYGNRHFTPITIMETTPNNTVRLSNYKHVAITFRVPSVVYSQKIYFQKKHPRVNFYRKLLVIDEISSDFFSIPLFFPQFE